MKYQNFNISKYTAHTKGDSNANNYLLYVHLLAVLLILQLNNVNNKYICSTGTIIIIIIILLLSKLFTSSFFRGVMRLCLTYLNCIFIYISGAACSVLVLPD